MLGLVFPVVILVLAHVVELLLQVCFMLEWCRVDETVGLLVVRHCNWMVLLFIVIVLLVCHHWLVMHLFVSDFIRVRGRDVVLNVVMDFMVDNWMYYFMVDYWMYHFMVFNYWMDVKIMVYDFLWMMFVVLFFSLMDFSFFFQLLIEIFLLFMDLLTINFMLLLHFKLCNSVLCHFQFPLKLVLLF